MPMGGSMTRGETGEDHTFFLGEVGDEETIRTLHLAVDQGFNFFDTAAAYGAGHSEELLGRAFAGRRDEVVIATKFGKQVDEERRWFGFYPTLDEVVRNLRRECEASLRRLNTDYIDLYQFHLLDFPLPPGPRGARPTGATGGRRQSPLLRLEHRRSRTGPPIRPR